MAKLRELTKAERMSIVVENENGATLQQIAKKFNISPEGVKKIIQKVKKTGSAKNIARSGRPPVTSARNDRKIIRAVKANPKISTR